MAMVLRQASVGDPGPADHPKSQMPPFTRKRYYEWLRRSAANMAGFPGELWQVVPKNPANDWVRAKAKDLGRDYDDSNIAYYTSRSLLFDVLHAAGAIEYTVACIDAANGAAQTYAEKHNLKADSEDIPTGLGAPEVDQAYIEYATPIELAAHAA
jgi:hypothetical protein